MRYAIVNADDFGYSDGICKSILELLNANAISATSLMCAAHGASERFRRWHVVDLRGIAGVHLQLTGGRPLSPVAEVPTLVDPETGNFRNPRKGDLPEVEQVEVEWRRQIQLACDVLGGTPSHLDSHHGVHRIPELFHLYCGLAAELGVPVRGATGAIATRMRTQSIIGTTTLVRDWTGRSLGPESLRQMVNSAFEEDVDAQVVEVISHPGYNDAYLTSVSSLSAAREQDHEALLQLSRMGWPRIDNIDLVSHAFLVDHSSKKEYRD